MPPMGTTDYLPGYHFSGFIQCDGHYPIMGGNEYLVF